MNKWMCLLACLLVSLIHAQTQHNRARLALSASVATAVFTLSDTSLRPGGCKGSITLETIYV
jgi:hypothetical protein